jgi:hypothetical protein
VEAQLAALMILAGRCQVNVIPTSHSCQKGIALNLAFFPQVGALCIDNANRMYQKRQKSGVSGILKHSVADRRNFAIIRTIVRRRAKLPMPASQIGAMLVTGACHCGAAGDRRMAQYEYGREICSAIIGIIEDVFDD